MFSNFNSSGKTSRILFPLYKREISSTNLVQLLEIFLSFPLNAEENFYDHKHFFQDQERITVCLPTLIKFPFFQEKFLQDD